MQFDQNFSQESLPSFSHGNFDQKFENVRPCDYYIFLLFRKRQIHATN